MGNIMLVGLGPHSKRIYLNYLKKYKDSLKVLVDLNSKRDSICKYLEENDFLDVHVWCLPDKYKDNEFLPPLYEKKLKNICKRYKITHIVVSTEPKAHNMYLNFALDNNINILSDKPITVVKGMQELDNIKKVRNQYYNLLNKYDKEACSCKIMCQRQYHRGYKYIKELLSDVVSKYNIPITYIDIYHCDGNWEMPHDLEKENHPYKYGYGKLYHSGYHFIDLLSEFLKINNLVSSDKRIVNGTIYGNVFTPDDEKVVFNSRDYRKIFNNDLVDGVYNHLSKKKYKGYGEKNFYSQLNFTNKDDKLITTANLNLLHYGFSRRGWFKSRDYYKKNGRVRHERINIQVGPLLNIQVHSYQSKEIKDRTNNAYEVEAGGLEHFDIDIYRNTDIIGGKPYERIKLRDLYGKGIINKRFIGYNEFSRKEFLDSFLNNNSDVSDLSNHELAIEILYSASKIIYDKVNNKKQIEKIRIPKYMKGDTSSLKNLGIVSDKDLGLKEKKLNKPRIRYGARGIVLRDDGKIAILNKSKKNEYKLPGGGVEDNESFKEAFEREVLEETGCVLSDIKELGFIEERRTRDNFKQISYVFIANVKKDTRKTNLTKKEIEEGGRIIWVYPEEGLKLIEKCIKKLKPSKYEDVYHTSFVVYRDMTILKYYLDNKKISGRWNNLYKNYINDTFKDWDSYFKIKMKLKKNFLKQVIKYSKSGKPILECGCGTGKSSVYFAKLGINSYAMDLENAMVEETKKLSKRVCPKNLVKAFQGDINSIPYDDKFFSVTHSSGVLEHYSDEEIIKMIDEQLRVSDYCIFSVPTSYFEKKMLGNERFLKRSEWRKIILRSKAVIVKETGYHYKTLDKRIIDVIKKPKRLFKPIALYTFVLKERDG